MRDCVGVDCAERLRCTRCGTCMRCSPHRYYDSGGGFVKRYCAINSSGDILPPRAWKVITFTRKEANERVEAR